MLMAVTCSRTPISAMAWSASGWRISQGCLSGWVTMGVMPLSRGSAGAHSTAADSIVREFVRTYLAVPVDRKPSSRAQRGHARNMARRRRGGRKSHLFLLQFPVQRFDGVMKSSFRQAPLGRIMGCGDDFPDAVRAAMRHMAMDSSTVTGPSSMPARI